MVKLTRFRKGIVWLVVLSIFIGIIITNIPLSNDNALANDDCSSAAVSAWDDDSQSPSEFTLTHDFSIDWMPIFLKHLDGEGIDLSRGVASGAVRLPPALTKIVDQAFRKDAAGAVSRAEHKDVDRLAGHAVGFLSQAPVLPISSRRFWSDSLSSDRNGREQKMPMRLLSMRKTSAQNSALSAALPSKATGSGTPQWAVIGWAGQ